MPKNLTSVTSASEWQYEPTFRPGSMSRVQTSFNTVGNNPSASSNSNKPQPRPLQNSGVIIGRTGSLRKAFTTSDEEDEATGDDERRPLQVACPQFSPIFSKFQQLGRTHNELYV